MFDYLALGIVVTLGILGAFIFVALAISFVTEVLLNRPE